MANYLQFSEIIDVVERTIKQYQSSMQTMVKAIINQVYLTEILQVDNLYPLHWIQAPINNKFHAPAIITGITAADPGVITSAAHGLTVGDVVSIWDVEGMEEINFDYAAYWSNIKIYVISETGFGVNALTLLDLWGDAVDTSGYAAYRSGGTILHHGWSVAGSSSDIINEISSVTIHDGSPLNIISWDELFESPDTWISSSSGTPSRFMQFRSFATNGTAVNYALTFPGAQENKLAYLMLELTGERLSADTDVPLLPPQFHDLLISGSIVRLAENNVQVENAVVWPGLYKAQLEALKTYNRKWWDRHKEDKAPYLL